LKPFTVEYFGPDKRLKSGLSADCKVCRNARSKLWHQANRDRARENAHRWYEENRERKLELDRERYQSDPDRAREKTRRWREANLEFARERTRQWRAANPDRARESTRRWREANPDKQKESARRWRLTNPDKKREALRLWHEENPEKVRIYQHNRRARKLNNGGTHTAEDIRALYKSQKGRCWYCGKKVGDNYHVDHRVPLSRGGSNAPENLVVGCPTCNLSKHDRLPHEWCGRLL
jgi:5-methylcytosine-specific restriction endonuclease McrA